MSKLQPDYTALQHRRQSSSYSPLREPQILLKIKLHSEEIKSRMKFEDCLLPFSSEYIVIWALKMETVCFSETYKSTRRYNAEQQHQHQNILSSGTQFSSNPMSLKLGLIKWNNTDFGCLRTGLKKIFESERAVVSGEWRKLHNNEFHNFYSSNIITMRWTEHVA
jgi:hypothetical protein